MVGPGSCLGQDAREGLLLCRMSPGLLPLAGCPDEAPAQRDVLRRHPPLPHPPGRAAGGGERLPHPLGGAGWRVAARAPASGRMSQKGSRTAGCPSARSTDPGWLCTSGRGLWATDVHRVDVLQGFGGPLQLHTRGGPGYALTLWVLPFVPLGGQGMPPVGYSVT